MKYIKGTRQAPSSGVLWPVRSLHVHVGPQVLIKLPRYINWNESVYRTMQKLSNL